MARRGERRAATRAPVEAQAPSPPVLRSAGAAGLVAIAAAAVAARCALQSSEASLEAECACDLDAWAPPTRAADKYVYKPGCDFDVLESFPTQEHFDATYWNRAPVLIRNGTSAWPSAIWTKRRLFDELRETNSSGSYLKTSDHWASYHLSSLHEKASLSAFLCNRVCKPPDGLDQAYIFDRDDWRARLPNVEAAIVTPSVIESHFDPSWHRRWSKYFLISALGSGINFHQHTNAFNGLLHGRKRWFLYPPRASPPSYKSGMIEWWQTVYVPKLRERHDGGLVAGAGLLQCMQERGDLLYVPQFWWHATLALGEGVGVSGQFVRQTHEILARATALAQAGRDLEAAELYRVVLDHRDEVEPPILVGVAGSLAATMLNAGALDKAKQAAELSLQLHAEHGGGDLRPARTVLARLQA